MQYFILIFWFISAIFGNAFLQFKLGPLNPFYIFSFFAMLYSIYVYINSAKMKKKFLDNKFLWLLITFFVLNLFYVIISLLNFNSIFNLDILYDRNYVFRQGYQIFILAIGIMCYNAFNKQKIKISFLRFLLLSSLVMKFVYNDGIIMHGLFLFLISRLFYEDKEKYKIIYLFVIIISTIRLLIGDAMMTYLAIYFLTSVFLLYDFVNKKIQLKNVKSIVLFFVVPFVILLGIIVVPKLINSDANTNWRFIYWLDELATLSKTYFIGVGYGTSYCTPNFLNVVNNANMFLDNYPTSIFVTTQHSSFINVFYRMGLIGGLLFTIILLYPFILHKKFFKRSKAAFLLYYCSLFTVIVNPGLESPRFMLFYVFSYAYLFSSIKKTSILLENVKQYAFKKNDERYYNEYTTYKSRISWLSK